MPDRHEDGRAVGHRGSSKQRSQDSTTGVHPLLLLPLEEEEVAQRVTQAPRHGRGVQPVEHLDVCRPRSVHLAARKNGNATAAPVETTIDGRSRRTVLKASQVLRIRLRRFLVVGWCAQSTRSPASSDVASGFSNVTQTRSNPSHQGRRLYSCPRCPPEEHTRSIGRRSGGLTGRYARRTPCADPSE